MVAKAAKDAKTEKEAKKIKLDKLWSVLKKEVDEYADPAAKVYRIITYTTNRREELEKAPLQRHPR